VRAHTRTGIVNTRAFSVIYFKITLQFEWNLQQEASVDWNLLLRECKELGWRVTDQEANATCRFLDKDKDGTWMGALKLLRAPLM
jgi:hypothetical protein